MNRKFIFHFRPRRVSPGAVRFTLTWGLGGMAALMIVQQLATGLLLGFFYEPLPVAAYQSVQHIHNSVFLGRLVRNLHHWTGHALVMVVFLHLLRVFVYDAFYAPRHRNWLIGLALGILVLTANFSGYLLPWDQLSYWAVTIATSMLGYIPGIGMFLQKMIRGGEEVGAGTLQLFYFFHTTVVPALMFVLMAYHFWFIRKAGGVLVPAGASAGQGNGDKRVPLSELLVRECAFAAVVTCMLLLFSMFVDAPLTGMANPDLTPPTVKAPWYFMGAQELLLHVHPLAAVCIVPVVIGSFLLLVPFVGTRDGRTRTVTKTLFLAGVVFLAVLTITGILFRGPAMKWVWPWQ